MYFLQDRLSSTKSNFKKRRSTSANVGLNSDPACSDTQTGDNCPFQPPFRLGQIYNMECPSSTYSSCVSLFTMGYSVDTEQVSFVPACPDGRLPDFDYTNFRMENIEDQDRVIMEYLYVPLRLKENEPLGLLFAATPCDDLDGYCDIFISEIDPNSEAGRDDRIQVNDQLIQINNQEVDSMEHLHILLQNAGRTVNLLLVRPSIEIPVMGHKETECQQDCSTEDRQSGSDFASDSHISSPIHDEIVGASNGMPKHLHNPQKNRDYMNPSRQAFSKTEEIHSKQFPKPSDLTSYNSSSRHRQHRTSSRSNKSGSNIRHNNNHHNQNISNETRTKLITRLGNHNIDYSLPDCRFGCETQTFPSKNLDIAVQTDTYAKFNHYRTYVSKSQQASPLKHAYPASRASFASSNSASNSPPSSVNSLCDIYERYAQIMYTTPSNLEHTIKLQQQLFQQQLRRRQSSTSPLNNVEQSPQSEYSANSVSAGQPVFNVAANKRYIHSGKDGENNRPVQPITPPMEWVVKKRHDGTRYVTRRPVRVSILKERFRQHAANNNSTISSKHPTGRRITSSKPIIPEKMLRELKAITVADDNSRMENSKGASNSLVKQTKLNSSSEKPVSSNNVLLSVTTI